MKRLPLRLVDPGAGNDGDVATLNLATGRLVLAAPTGGAGGGADLSGAPTVTGKISDGTALQSLLDSLATLGLDVQLTGSTALVFDEFTRADGPLNGTTTSDGSATWIADAGYSIVSNSMNFSAAANQYAHVNAGVADNFAVEFTCTQIAGSYPVAVVLRHNGTSGLRFYRHQPNNSWVLQGADGSYIGEIASTPDLAAGDVVRCEVVGYTYTLMVNGVALGSKTSSQNSTATSHGVGGNANCALKVDDFGVYPL